MIVQKLIKKLGNVLIALCIFILLIISGLLLVNIGQKPQLSIYSDDWDDISEFKADLEALNYNISHIRSSPIYLREIDKPEESVFIIAGLQREYNVLEVEAISSYINAGGSVILADDFGYGNSLVQNIKIPAEDYGSYVTNGYRLGYEFLNNQIVDIEYDRDPNYLKVTTDTFFQYKLLMNAPSGLFENKESGYLAPSYVESVEVLAQSSSLSWEDLNGNYSRDIGEKSGPFPLILKFNWIPELDLPSHFQSGIPGLILISDSSILINEMWDQADNREFILFQIHSLISDGGRVIFDESVHINENVILELTNGYYIFFIYIFSHPAIFIFIELILLILLVILISKRKQILYHRHKDNLDKKMLFMMLRPELDFNDYYWIRGIMLEKVRMGYKIPNDRFQYYTPDQIRVLLDDDAISEFLFGDLNGRRGYRFMFIDEKIINKILNWKPSSVIFQEVTNSDYKSQNFDNKTLKDRSSKIN